MEKAELVKKYGKAKLAGEGICLDREKDIEIEGENPNWKITFKGISYNLSISNVQRLVSPDKDSKRLLENSYGKALMMRKFERKCGATHMDMRRIWNKFCEYNNWEIAC